VTKSLRSFFALAFGIFVTSVVLYFFSLSPIEVLTELFNGMFAKPNYWSQILVKAGPLILTGLSVSLSLQAGLFNVGAEGQYIIGALTAGIVALKLNLPFFPQVLITLMCAVFTSGLWGVVQGVFKIKYNIHEVITSIMLNWTALHLSNYLVMLDSFKRPNTETTDFVSPQSSLVLFENFKTSVEGKAWLEQYPLLEQFLRPSLNWSIIVGLVLCFVIWYILYHTTWGHAIRKVGFSAEATRYSGGNPAKVIIWSTFASGALSGLAGAFMVLGVAHNVSVLAQMEGYGFDGLAASLMGGAHPIGTALNAIFLAALKYSGQKLQSSMSVPGEIITLMIGIIILFIALDKFYETLRERFRL
jgi:simple sugar transport system permease protein